MDMYKTKIILLIALVVCGCRTKKLVSKTEIKKSDTLIVKTEVIKAPVLNQSLTIKEICDSVTGEVVRFKKVFVVDGDSIEILTNENNELSIKIAQLEKTLKKKDSIARISDSKETSDVHETIYRKDWRWIIGTFILGSVFGFFKPWKHLSFLRLP